MMAKKSLHHIVLSAVITAASIVGSAPAYSAPGSSQSSDVVIARITQKETNEVVELTVPPSTLAQRRAASPQALRSNVGRQELIESLKAQCGQKKGLIRNVIHEFPADAGAFYAGLFLASESQLQKDPAAFRHFAEQNLVDPMAHVSFAFFMLGSSGTQAALSMMGLAFDPCSRLRDGNLFVVRENKLTGKKEFGLKPTRLQKRASVLVGPLSMSGGFLLSSLVHEFIADPNIQLCSVGFGRDLAPEQQMERDRACETAYEDWVIEGKIRGYVPDLLSMVGTSFLQGYLINTPVAAGYKLLKDKLENKIPGLLIKASMTGRTTTYRIALQAFNVLQVVGSAHPLVQFGLKAVNALIFVTVNDIIVPYFKFPYERSRQGEAITNSMNSIFSEIDRTEKNGWLWKPKPKPAACSYEPTPVEIGNGYMPPLECMVDDQKPVDQLVRKLGDRYKKWREFVLADAYMAHSNWKDYLTKFQHRYADAYHFYDILLQSIAWKNTPGAAKDDLVELLYSASPFNGLDITVPAKVCDLSKEDAEKIKDAAAIARAALDERTSGKVKTRSPLEIGWLEKIARGLEAADCSKPVAGARENLLQLRDKGVKVSKDDWAEVDNQIRSQRFGEAMDTLHKALDKNSVYADFGLNPKSSGYAAFAAWNPFAKLKAVLGNPNPLPAGIQFLQEMDQNPQVIAQEFKQDHPGGVGRMARARTATMSDYLLAQMVCGPQADPSDETKIRIYNEQKQSMLTKTLNYIVNAFSGVDLSDMTRTLEDSTSMVYVQYAYEDTAAPKPGWNLGSDDLALIPRVWGVRAEFRPPRIISDVGYDFCADHRKGAQLDYPDWDIHRTVFDVNGEKVQGFLNVVKKFARPDIVGKDNKSFAFRDWWDKNVDTHMVRVIDMFRQDFRHIIENEFIPKFMNTETVTYNGRKFESGVARSLESEAKFNLTLIGKGYLVSVGEDKVGPRKARAEFQELAEEFMKHLRLQTMLFSDPYTAEQGAKMIEEIALGKSKFAPKGPVMKPSDTRFRKAFEANKEILGMILDDIGALTRTEIRREQSKAFTKSSSEPSQTETRALDTKLKPEAQETLKKVREAAMANLLALVTETDSYFGVVDTIRVEGLK